MMHYFVEGELSTDGLFHDESMLVRTLALGVRLTCAAAAHLVAALLGR